MDSSVVGKRIKKLKADRLVTGRAEYLDDIRLRGMLIGRILRSPYGHARIVNIDVSAAKQLPGVRAVITAEDTEKVKFCHLPVTPNKMALNDVKVRFIGDEVAAVAAVDEDTADEALALIRVSYNPLPAVYDPEAAMQPNAPQIYEESPDNIAGRFMREFGDLEKGFAQSDYVFEEKYCTPFIPSCTIEPHGCIAHWDGSDRLMFWASTQNPSNYRNALSQVLKIPQSSINVIRPDVGGAFGNKSVILPMDPIAAILSKKSGRPVKIVSQRQEEFTCCRGRYPMIIYLKTGVCKDGRLLARQATVITDNGAYNNKASGISALTCNRIGNLYRVPHTRTESIIVYTNNQYGGALRGWGGPQAHFAVESQIDTIAERLGMDPLELRLINANRCGDVTGWGWNITSCGLCECLEKAAQGIGWRAKGNNKPNRGIGIASVIHTGAGSAGTHGVGNFGEVNLKVNPDGSVHLIVGESEIGQGSDTVLSQIAAEILGVGMDQIAICSHGTDLTPPSMGTWGSRVTFIAGNAVRLAAENAKAQLLHAASRILGDCTPETLTCAGGLIFHPESQEKFITIGDAALYCAHRLGKPITARGVYEPPNASPPDPKTGYGNYCPTYAFGAQAAEVAVDPETGRVRVLRIVAAHDVGKAINPTSVEGQIEGGVAMGIGYALFEGAKRQQGLVINDHFVTHKILNAPEAPEVVNILVETDDPAGPFGAKGVGEPPVIPTAPAIANAIFDAVGVRITELPITPDKILKALEEKAKRGVMNDEK